MSYGSASHRRVSHGVPLTGPHLIGMPLENAHFIGVPSYGRACHGRPISIVAITGKGQKGRIRYVD
jgi:hypothetical protein